MPVASGLTPQSQEINFGNPSADTQIWFHYQTFPPPGYAAPTEYIRMFRRTIDPLFVPLWVCTVYRTPAGGDLTFWHMAISVGNDHAGDPLELGVPRTREMELHARDYELRSIRYGDERVPRPFRLIEILEGPLDKLWQRLPGDFIQLNASHYWKIKGMAWWADELAKHHVINSETDLLDLKAKQYEVECVENIKRIDKRWRAESDYRWDHDWGYMQRQIEGLTTEEQALVLKERRNRTGGYIGHTLPPGIDYRQYLPGWKPNLSI